MNLQTHIKPELWAAISSTYQSKNYSHAVVDAMHYLSDLLREKSGTEGDGASLVGQALGGETPRLRVNKLQTDSERNVQKGLIQILSGMYQAIRNPRSHETIEDDQPSADSIIYFINYLIGILDQSREPYSMEDFLIRVFDPDFVQSEEYATELVAEIPQKKLLDTLVEIYRNKLSHDGKKLSYVINAIFKVLSEDQIQVFMDIISDELKMPQSHVEDEIIRIVLQILSEDFWIKLRKVARLRIETKLIGYIKEGFQDDNNKCNFKGSLATWSNSFLKYFDSPSRIFHVIIGKLASNNINERRYAAGFFMSHLPEFVQVEWHIDQAVNVISKAIKENDDIIKDNLFLYSFPDNWRQKFAEALKDVKKADGTLYFANEEFNLNDIPF